MFHRTPPKVCIVSRKREPFEKGGIKGERIHIALSCGHTITRNGSRNPRGNMVRCQQCAEGEADAKMPELRYDLEEGATPMTDAEIKEQQRWK